MIYLVRSTVWLSKRTGPILRRAPLIRFRFTRGQRWLRLTMLVNDQHDRSIPVDRMYEWPAFRMKAFCLLWIRSEPKQRVIDGSQAADLIKAADQLAFHLDFEEATRA